MSYQVGIDLGTTFTSAAVYRDGRSSIFHLGSQSAAIPSVVLLRSDETELTGEAAVRRAITEPERVAREFKRRLGDTTPIIVGGSPYSAEQLMARLLKFTVAEVAKREGGPADRVGITHPANWGPYKVDLLNQAIRLAGLPSESVDLLTEPEAAAVSYASQQRVEPGEIIAVYDLGGGTFDAAVLRRTDDGFEILGRPEGIERMGGIDFDAAIFAFVNRSLDGKLADLDSDDPMVISGVSRLRDECIDAKVALSSDTDATVPVLLPGIQTEVRITRNEFESLIRPSLADSIGAMHRALESAGVTPAEVSRVLLVGGSSRIPLISQMVSSELGRPVAVDADPKHAVALGAAAFAAGVMSGRSTKQTAPPVIVPAFEPVVPPTQAAPVIHDPQLPTEPIAAAAGLAAAAGATAAMITPAPTAPSAPTAHGGSATTNRTPMILGIVAAVAALIVVAFVVLGGGSDGTSASDPTVAPAETRAAVTTDATVSTDAPTTKPPTTEPPAPPSDAELQTSVSAAVRAVDPSIAVSVSGAVATLSGQVGQTTATAAIDAARSVEGLLGVNESLTILADDEVCSDPIKAFDRWACIDSAVSDGTTITATYTFDDAGTPWNVSGGFHLHFFSDAFEPTEAGAPGGGGSIGGAPWVVWDTESTFTATVGDLGGTVDRLCVRIANPDHTLETLDAGNCFPVTRAG